MIKVQENDAPSQKQHREEPDGDHLHCSHESYSSQESGCIPLQTEGQQNIWYCSPLTELVDAEERLLSEDEVLEHCVGSPRDAEICRAFGAGASLS